MLKKINNLISRYRYKFKKMSVRIERPKVKHLSSIQEKVINIVTDILLDPESELHTNPLDNKIYLKKIEDNKINVFVIISSLEKGFNVNISGKNFIKNSTIIEKFHYNVYIPTISGKIIINKFNKKLKRIVTKMEAEIINENDSNLSDLIISLKKDD